MSQRPRLIVTYPPPGRPPPDISVQRFLAPPASVDSGAGADREGDHQECGHGGSDPGINAGFKISGTVPYSSPRTGISLGVGESTDVTFDSWVPARCGTFTTRCTVQVAGDVNRMNDTLNGSVSVRYRDVGCAEILQWPVRLVRRADCAAGAGAQLRHGLRQLRSRVLARDLLQYPDHRSRCRPDLEVSIKFPLPYWQPRRRTFGVKFHLTIFTTDMNHGTTRFAVRSGRTLRTLAVTGFWRR